MRAIDRLFVFIAFGLLAGPVLADVEVDIPSQPVGDALNQFAEQSGLQVVMYAGDAEGVETEAVQGTYEEPTEVLDTLLASTGLEYNFINDRTVSVSAAVEDERGASDSKNLSPMPVLMAQNQTNPSQTTSSRSEGGTSIVTGKVTDARTGANLKGAKVSIEETGQWTSTNDLGEFRFVNVPTGSATLTVSYLGYAGQSAVVGVRGDGTSQDFALRGGSEIEEIVVFGQRSARALALNQERTAENFRSVASSDQLGDFQGTTISEALRKLPGVTFLSDTTGTGDGTNIVIRGLSPGLNAVEINGVTVPVANGQSRTANLGNILVDSIESVSISKTLLPNQNSAGTGGLVQIETKSPLDRPSRFFNFGVEAGSRPDDFLEDYLVTSTASGVFGMNENVGLSGSFQYRNREVTNIEVGGIRPFFGQYLPLAPDGSTSITSINQIDPRVSFPFEENSSDSYFGGGQATTRTIDTTTFAATISGEVLFGNDSNIRWDLQRSEDEQDLLLMASNMRLAGIGYQELPVASLGGELRRVLSWEGNVAQLEQNYILDPRTKTTTDTASLRGVTNLRQWSLRYHAGYAKGRTRQPGRMQLTAAFGGSTQFDPSFIASEATDDIEGRILSLYGEAADSGLFLPLLSGAGWNVVNDPTLYDINSGSAAISRSTNEIATGDLSARREFDASWLNYLELGVFVESSRFQVQQNRFSLQGDASVDALGLGYDASPLQQLGASAAFRFPSEGSFRSFIRERLPSPGDADATFAWNPIAQPDGTNGQFTDEDSISPYLQGRLDLGRLEIIGGVRLNRVETTSTILSAPRVLRTDFTFDTDFEAEFTRLSEASVTTTDVLPRIVANFRQTNDLIYRAGYFLSVARPSVTQLSRQQDAVLILPPFFGPSGNQPWLLLLEGNPDLKPATTHNFDASVEYYFRDIGALKLSLFYKYIDNLLENNRTIQSNDVDGSRLPDHPYFQSLPANLYIERSRPVNSDEKSTLWGVEVNAERQFSFLPGAWAGLGASANFAYTDSSKTEHLAWTSPDLGATSAEFSDVRFSSQSKYSGTAAITYSSDNLDARIGYSFQDRRPLSFSGHGLSRWSESEDTLDLRIEYRWAIGDSVTRLYLEGSDLLTSSSEDSFAFSVGGEGSTPQFTQTRRYFGGRSIRVGVNTTF